MFIACSILPVIVVYFILSKHIVSGMTVGAVANRSALINEEGKIQYERNCDLFSDKKSFDSVMQPLINSFKGNIDDYEGLFNFVKEVDLFELFKSAIFNMLILYNKFLVVF